MYRRLFEKDEFKTDEASRSFWASAALCIAIGGSLLAIALYGIDRTEKRFLADDAEQTALNYAKAISQKVPDLENLFSQRQLSQDAKVELLKTGLTGDVFRFKLFAPSGHLLIISDDLDAVADVTAENTLQLDVNHTSNNAQVSDIVLGGDNYIELKDGRDIQNRPDVYTEAYVPLMGANGLLGVVEVYVDQSARQRRISAAFADVAMIVFVLLFIAGLGLFLQAWLRIADRRRGESEIKYLAEHDVLSGVLNRASFEKVLTTTAEAARLSDQKFAIHYVDIDRFKEVNDTLGHSLGDRVLCEVADRLTNLVHQDNTVARLGGDEFAVLQVDINGPRDVEEFGKYMVEALSSPLDIEGHMVPCGGSVGAACFGIDALDISELLHKADLAMYRSKQSGRGRFSFYDEALDRELEERRLLTVDLRTALADGALSLHYQPLFDASLGGKAVGYEALMRWQHPVHGNVPPSVFIPLAEDCGQIEALGTWAIGQACSDAAQWGNGLRVAVNLSPAQFTEGAQDVVSVVTRALEQTGLPANRLELEITESLLIGDPELVLESLNRLSNLGVKIAMDDFGTGYSSLAYLWRFPFDKVKIDKSFVDEMSDGGKVSMIIASIVSLAHLLGMRVNAEGVETEWQREALRKLGCDELQGFLLGRPAPLQLDNETHQRAA